MLESVPKTNQYWALAVKCFGQGNNGSLWWSSKSRLNGIHRLLVRRPRSYREVRVNQRLMFELCVPYLRFLKRWTASCITRPCFEGSVYASFIISSSNKNKKVIQNIDLENVHESKARAVLTYFFQIISIVWSSKVVFWNIFGRV